MISIIAELEGLTDLPVQVLGIHPNGDSGFDPRMFNPHPSSWMREDAENQPWLTWRVPIASRPAQDVRWKDVMILDENNEFVAVQNLDQESLNSGANRTKLKQAIQSAATITDTDIDDLPDSWELNHLGGIGSGQDTPVPGSGLPALLAYAFSQPPGDYDSERNPKITFHENGAGVFPQVEYRRRLGGEGERLEYRVEISDDGSSWRGAGGELAEVSATNPWDGSGTEIVTLRSQSIIGNSFRFARIVVEVPL